MLDFPAIRGRLAEIASGAVEHEVVTVYPLTPETITAPQLVAIGQPSVRAFDAQPCIDRIEWPIAVVVAPGGSGAFGAAQGSLERLWPVVAEAYRDALTQDQSLGGLVAAAEVARAEFGEFVVSGAPYPAQLIHLTLYG